MGRIRLRVPTGATRIPAFLRGGGEMTRSFFVPAVFGVLVCALTAVADDDPVKKKLEAAKETYSAEMGKFRQAAEEWFDKREEIARKAGNKALVDQIKTERQAFRDKDELPKTATTDLKQKPAAARKALEAAYKTAVKEYTKASKDAEAAAAEKELEALVARGPVADARPFAAGSIWKGTRKWGATADDTDDGELEIKAVTKDGKFTGELRLIQGGKLVRKVAVQGDVKGNSVSFVTDRDGKSVQKYAGTLRDNTITFEFSGTSFAGRQISGTLTVTLDKK
jgi:hypothetical protein